MRTQFIPNDRYLLVRRVKPEERTQGGLVIPDQAKTARDCGIVIKRGDDPERDPEETMEVLPGPDEGDLVFFPGYAAERINLLDADREQEYLMIDKESLFGYYPSSFVEE
jgi:co-chaperonin GroES (HSP10)